MAVRLRLGAGLGRARALAERRTELCHRVGQIAREPLLLARPLQHGRDGDQVVMAGLGRERYPLDLTGRRAPLAPAALDRAGVPVQQRLVVERLQRQLAEGPAQRAGRARRVREAGWALRPEHLVAVIPGGRLEVPAPGLQREVGLLAERERR